MSSTKSSSDEKLQLIERIEKVEKLSREGYAGWKKKNKVLVFNLSTIAKVS